MSNDKTPPPEEPDFFWLHGGAPFATSPVHLRLAKEKRDAKQDKDKKTK